MADQNVEVANARGIGKHGRYGGQLGTYRIYKRNILADESVPTDVREATVVGDRFEECRWVVKKPAGITTYDAHFLRWAVVLDKEGNEIIAGEYVEEDVVTVTESLVFDQYVNGDRLACYIDATAGAFGAGFIILRKGINKHA